MLDISLITKAVEDILKEHTEGYTIVRNEMRNEDPNVAAGKGWIGIYRGRVLYNKGVIGTTNPWTAAVEIVVEIQVADMSSGENLETNLIRSEQEVLGILNDHPNLDQTVYAVDGYNIEYDINQGAEIMHQAAIITIRATART